MLPKPLPFPRLSISMPDMKQTSTQSLTQPFTQSFTQLSTQSLS